MPDKTTEERLATLEAQVQGLANHIAEEVHGWDDSWRMGWIPIDEEGLEMQWAQVYDWERDPQHPLHQKAASGGA